MTEHMNTGDVSRRLGVTVTAEFLASLGIAHVAKDKRAFLYAEEQWPVICKTVGNHIRSRADAPRAEKPAPSAKKPTKASAPPANDDEDDEL